jgi:hypothetical protein
MPIDFNRQMIFDPKINIIGDEVPLAEMEKTGDALQARYDVSRENYNKFQELEKQTEQIADPLEREKVREYISSMRPEVEQIANNGDYHNMRFQTMAMANNAANNLKVFGERAAEAKKYRDLIAANEKLGDEKTKTFYQNKLNKIMDETKYNSENKTFNFTPLQLPKIVEDYDVNKFLQSATQGWMANKYGAEAANMTFLRAGEKIPGVGGTATGAGVYNTKTGRQDTSVNFNEVYNNALKMASGERGLQAMLERDFEIESEGKNLNPEQQKQLKASITKKYLEDPLTGFANKAAFTQSERTEDVSFDNNATANYNAGMANNSDNQGMQDVFESTMNPGEKSALVASLTEIGKTIDKSQSGKYVPGKDINAYDIKLNPEYQNKARLIFSGLSVPNLRKMRDGSPEQKELYRQLHDANVYGVYNAIMDNKNVNRGSYEKIINILNDNNYIPPTSYKWVSTNDKRLLNELVQTDNSIITKDGRVDSDKAQQALNKRLFGNNAGLVIDKAGKFVGGNIEGLDIMEPETGKVVPFKEAYEKNEFGLKEGNLFDASNTIQVNGKILPGSLAHATSENPQQDLSYFGNGYTINANGRQLVVAKRGRESLNTNSAKLNDLASFSRYSRDEKEYRTTDNIPVKIKSDVSGNVVITVNGKAKPPIPQDTYNAILQNLGDAGVNPINYLPQLELFKK